MDFRFLVLIFFGSALGGMARYWVSGWVAVRVGERFPTGTLIVNITGAFAIGLIWAAPLIQLAGRELLRDFLMFGLLGGYTTVSSFTWNTFTLWQDGEWLYAAANVIGSFFLCLLAAFAGASIGATLPF